MAWLRKVSISFGLISVLFVLPLVSGAVRTSAFKCPKNKFKCNSEKCIPSIWTCDGDDDCGDRSDEKNCTPATCKPITEFTCSNKKCIPKRYVVLVIRGALFPWFDNLFIYFCLVVNFYFLFFIYMLDSALFYSFLLTI